MRKLFIAVLAFVGASTLLSTPARVYAQATTDEGIIVETAPETKAVTRAARLRSSNLPHPANDPDTVWIGHIFDATYDAGGKMIAGGAGPYHVGRGPNFVTRSGGTAGSNGTWDFDRFQLGETDSLQGWWPANKPYQSTGAFVGNDFERAFHCLDYGNQVNYIINQGSPKRTFGVVGVWHRDHGNRIGGADPTDSSGVTVSAGRATPNWYNSGKAYPAAVGTYGPNVQPVTWSPTTLGGPSSTCSAWMGMRAHGDNTERDGLSKVDHPSDNTVQFGGTGNPFNASLFQYQGVNFQNNASSTQANGTDHNFPGYGSQMDQMLYRDVVVSGDWLNISMNYSTNMSTGMLSTTASKCGWFDKDPVSPAGLGTWDPFANVPSTQTASNDGNFISSSLSSGVIDSFMVYIGAPVNDQNVKFSGTLTVAGFPITTVYDKKRRWFSEVLRCVASDDHYRELLSTFGNNLVTGSSAQGGFHVEIPTSDSKLSDILAASGGKVRIVIRSKTNRGFDDENGGNTTSPYTSNTRGAAIVDNVIVNGSNIGDFEAENSIDNDTSVPATTAWKSTGKPPAVYWHVRPLAGSYFSDPCGGVDTPIRQCNMYGNVVTPGDNDDAEHQTGPYGTNLWERGKWLVSPTVNLVATANGTYNGQGIDDEIARPTGNYTSFFSIFNGGLVRGSTVTGNFISIHYQSYPARQVNGSISWGETISNGSISSYGAPRGCFETFFIGAKSNNVIKTTNPQQRPDSLRYYVFAFTRCFGQFISDATCGTLIGFNVGYYLDNLSLAIIDSPPPANISLSIWNLLNDAFPMNATDAVVAVGESFDTCGAQIRNNLNNAPNSPRSSVTGDSAIVSAAGSNTRVDMIFRIKPGPGNFVSTGHMSTGIAKTPQGKVAAASGDGSFFGTYMEHVGYFGSGTAAGGDPAGGPAMSGGWNIHTWLSARCDTAERNLFPTANNTGVIGISLGTYAAMYHEGDPTGNAGSPDIDNQRFTNATFNVPRVRCVMPIPTGATNHTNIRCDGGGWTSYTPTSSGWDGSTTTQEYKKIIPDGLLTPGSHVEYFFRRCDAGVTSVFDMAPDTNFVIQGSEGSTDGHRWQEFSVLPDAWKRSGWAQNEADGPAPACMLYIDWNDRRGDERIWVGVADTIGATIGQYNGSGYPSGRWGAHNGWHARGDQIITVAISTDPTIAVYAHGGSPGTIWDMFGVKASESTTTGSSIGSRSAAVGVGYLAGQENKNGPTGKMLRQFYRVLFADLGDLDAGPIGPYSGRTDNDVQTLIDYADDSKPGGYAAPRAVYMSGRNFMNGQINGGGSGHPTWPPTYFGAGIRDDDYRNAAANSKDFIDLTPFSPVVTTNAIYGVNNFCTITNDWLTTAVGGASYAAKYEATGVADEKGASIYQPAVPSSSHSHVSLVDGYRWTSLGSRNSGSFTQAASSLGRIDYFAQLFKTTGLFGSLGCYGQSAGAPAGVGDSPNNALVYFLALRSENPFRSGAAKITFGIIRKERVELKVYDVTGRLVKTLANRDFEAGSHDLFWDGTNDNGELVAKGVYFYQVRTPSFVSQKKLAVLKN